MRCKTLATLNLLTLLIVPMSIMLGSSGCITQNVGEPTFRHHPISANVTERIEGATDITVNIVSKPNTVDVAVGLLANMNLVEEKEVIVFECQKKCTIGLYPGFPYEIEVSPEDKWILYAVGPWGAIMLNTIPLLGMPTLSTLFIEPFLGYDSLYLQREEIKITNKEWPRGAFRSFLSASGLLGCRKYMSFQIDTNIVSKAIQQNIPRRIPLENAVVELASTELNYKYETHTDERGIARFAVNFGDLRQAEFTVIFKGCNDRVLAEYAQPFINRNWSYDVRFAELNELHQRQTLTGRSALPSPTWILESVALADIALAGVSHDEGQALSEWFFNSMADSRYFRLVNRADMARILEEQRFQAENCSDTECLVEMGKLLAARYIIGGRLARIQDQAVLTARMVDVESGEVIATARESSGTTTQEMLTLMTTVADSLCRTYGRHKKD